MNWVLRERQVETDRRTDKKKEYKNKIITCVMEARKKE